MRRGRCTTRWCGRRMEPMARACCAPEQMRAVFVVFGAGMLFQGLRRTDENPRDEVGRLVLIFGRSGAPKGVGHEIPTFHGVDILSTGSSRGRTRIGHGSRPRTSTTKRFPPVTAAEASWGPGRRGLRKRLVAPDGPPGHSRAWRLVGRRLLGDGAGIGGEPPARMQMVLRRAGATGLSRTGPRVSDRSLRLPQ